MDNIPPIPIPPPSLSSSSSSSSNSLTSPQQQSLYPRHGAHHGINVKYGFVIFAISIVHILFFLVIKFIQVKRWMTTSRFNKTLSKLSNPSTVLLMFLWCLIVFFVGGHKITKFLEEYMIVAKRYGRIAYCLLPLNIYLILRPTNSGYLKPGYYLENLNLHKWISRLIAICSLIHAIGFFYKWNKEGTLITKSFRFLNSLGLIAFIFLTILIIISIRFLRRKYYSLFYIIHNITAWSMVVLIVFHARPGVTVFGIICLILLTYQLYLRFFATYVVDTLKIWDIPTSSLQIVKIPKPGNFPPWLPGSHIRLNYRALNIRSWIGATHPFTIANIPEDGVNNLTLIINKPGNFVIDQYLSYLLTGPYVSVTPPFFKSAKMINIICGGSGISFGLPIFNHYRSLNINIPIKLVWCTRNQSDTFIMNQIDMTGVQVFVTSVGDGSSSNSNSSSSNSPSPSGSSSYQPIPLFVIDDEQGEQKSNYKKEDQFVVEEEEEGHGLLNEQEEGIPLQNIKKETTEKDQEKQHPTPMFKYGRPKFDEVFAVDDPTLNPSEFSNDSWVIACGPEQLIKDAKQWSEEKEYQFYSEKYEM